MPAKDLNRTQRGNIPAHPKQEAVRRIAKQEVDKIFQDSHIEDARDKFPKFDFNELQLGKVLGKGGFATVYEIKAFLVPPQELENYRKSVELKPPSEETRATAEDTEVTNSSTPDEYEFESRRFISDHCTRKGGNARYAVKILSAETKQDLAMYCQGLIDMAIETHVLSDIKNHPNICKLRAIAQVDAFADEYFIVMDRLYDTLEKRIGKWKQQSKGGCCGPNGTVVDSYVYIATVTYAFDLAAALEYLHKRKIIYRDLKPENIGFDIRDDIRLFDFGLAKELTSKDKASDGLYNLTEMTGTLRYMAPEVANAVPYNEKCDSYSFAILFWQMLTHKEPFAIFTLNTLREQVYNGSHLRPTVSKMWPPAMQKMFEQAWHQNVHQRLSTHQISQFLRTECLRVKVASESTLDMRHSTRRSTHVMKSKHASQKRLERLAKMSKQWEAEAPSAALGVEESGSPRSGHTTLTAARVSLISEEGSADDLSLLND